MQVTELDVGLEHETGHVIVCGLHGVGVRIVELLHQAEVRTVVVDDHPDPGLTRLVRRGGIPHLVGDSRLADTLQAAALAGAAAGLGRELRRRRPQSSVRPGRARPRRPRPWC